MRFSLDSPRADERSIMHYGSVDKVYNKMNVDEQKVWCKLYLYLVLFSLEMLNYRGADKCIHI